MAVRFKLRTPNGDKETAIFLIYYYDGKKFQQATGRRILPKFWNTDIESGRVLLNRIIKDAAKIAGIDSPTRQTYKSRGESLEKTKMKSRMVSTKICRKTFVSNFRQTGIPTNLLYLMTGHESGKSAAMANTYDARQFERNVPVKIELRFM